MNRKSCLYIALCATWLIACLTAEAQNVNGRITCNGKGVEGVAVSDGIVVVKTDKEGHYQLQSDKQNGYVFYSLPSGYEPEAKDGFNPLFWQRLTYSDPVQKETHNFGLRKVKNNHYFLVVGADTHLANRNNDLRQFSEGFIKKLYEEKQAAGSTPIYSTLLGDLSWDNFWYSNKYDLSDFMNTLSKDRYPMLLFPVMGNHDNNGAATPDDNTDFNAADPYRRIVCPNYYSYNLGKIHYVVLDDIYYKNEDTGGKYREGIVGSRNYDGFITEDQFQWLERDLALVDRKTPVIVELHIPVWRLPTDGKFTFTQGLTKGRYNSAQRLCELLRPYRTVHILSGHTHYNYHAHPTAYPNIHENNIAAVCATWWQTGVWSGRHICKDGTPGGYELMEVNGTKIKWEYHSMEDNGNLQFRVYDTNELIHFYQSDPTIKKMLKKYNGRQDYGKYEPNALLVNVFNYDTDWKIEAVEGKQKLQVERVVGEDPLHTLTYDVPIFKEQGKYGEGSATNKTCHLFLIRSTTATGTIQLTVTDSFGKKHQQKVVRPLAFSVKNA